MLSAIHFGIDVYNKIEKVPAAIILLRRVCVNLAANNLLYKYSIAPLSLIMRGHWMQGHSEGWLVVRNQRELLLILPLMNSTVCLSTTSDMC